VSNIELDAADAIRRFLLANRGLALLEPELQELGSIKRAVGEATSQLHTVRAENAKEQAAVDGVRAECKAMWDEADALRAKAQAEADEAARRAEQNAAEVIAKASAKADEIVAGAQQRAAQLKADNVKQSLALDVVNAEIAQGTAKLTEIQAQIAELRRKF
jgi:uncharacterized coiled-coil DUF342 family protein